MLKPGFKLTSKDPARDAFLSSLIDALERSKPEITHKTEREKAVVAYRALQFDYPVRPALRPAMIRKNDD